jgi:hypothetical protein
VEVVGVGDVASLFPAWAFVWGDVDPHGSSLGAGEPGKSINRKPSVKIGDSFNIC